jgi:hypothetical protein
MVLSSFLNAYVCSRWIAPHWKGQLRQTRRQNSILRQKQREHLAPFHYFMALIVFPGYRRRITTRVVCSCVVSSLLALYVTVLSATFEYVSF